LRPIEPKDMPQVIKLHTECFPVRYDDKFYQKLVDHKWLSILAVKRAEDVGTNIGTSTAEEVIGFVTGRVDRTDVDWLLDLVGAHELHGYISTIGVSPQYRKMGLATYLLQEMCAQLEEVTCTHVSLHVIDYNQAAINFYIKNAFEIAERLENFYEIDAKWYNAYLMQKRLPSQSTGAWAKVFRSILNGLGYVAVAPVSLVARWLAHAPNTKIAEA